MKDWSPIVRKFTEDALGPAISEAGLLAADVVSIVRTPFTAFRLKCIGAVMKKARDLVGEREVKPLPTGYAVSMIDGMKDCDEPTLQDMWARLLAGAVLIDAHHHPMFVDALRRMSVPDARVFGDVIAARAVMRIGRDLLVLDGCGLAELDALGRLEVLSLVQPLGMVEEDDPRGRRYAQLLTFGEQLRDALNAS